MFLVKVKPLGWLLIALIFFGVGMIGYAASRLTGGHAMAEASAASTSDGAVPTFSETASYDHLSGTAPEVVGALKADDLDRGEKCVNKPCTFQGTVVKVFVPPSKAVTILNFSEDYNDAMSAVIQAPNYGAFPDPAQLVGKRVLVTGTMIVFKAHLEINVDSREQLHIIDGSAGGQGTPLRN